MTTTLTVTDITASFDGQHHSLTQASPFIEVQAVRGDCAHTQAANVEHGHGRSAARASKPVTLERAGSQLVIKVTARAKDLIANPAVPAATEDTIASARILAESPTGSNGMQTAVLLDNHGRAVGEVTCKVEEVSGAEAVPDSPSSNSHGSGVGAHVKSALETAAEKTLKLASCVRTAPKTATADSEAVYSHQDNLCAALGTFPAPMTGTSFLRM
jgi:hypothetical protein